MFGKMSGFDPKQNVLQELMQYLDKKDDDDLGSAMKPKGVGLEVTKIQGLGGDDKDDQDQQSPGIQASKDPMAIGDDSSAPDMGKMADGGDMGGMSKDEIDELIQALQSKLGG